MSRTTIAKKAYIEIALDYTELDVPEEFYAILQTHISSNPTMLYLPWSPDLLPARGDEITFPAISGELSEVRADTISYSYCKEDGVVAYCYATGWKVNNFNLQALKEIAEEGFLLETMEPIQQVLTNAGLYESLVKMFES